MYSEGTMDEAEVKKNIISKQACFAQLTDTELGELARLWVEEERSAGNVIVTEGDDVDSVYLIIDGVAEVHHDRVVNHIIQSEVLAQLGPGDAIGLNETGFYSLSGRRTATVVAITDMVILRLNVAAFHGFTLMHSHANNVMRDQARKFLKME